MMTIISQLACLLVLAAVGQGVAEGAECGGYPEGHTMCLPKGEACAGDLKCSLDANDVRQVLHRHNCYRNKVAGGLELRGAPGPQPEAKDMRVLVWDEELALIAQRWADQLKFAHDPDSARVTLDRRESGQNIALAGSSAPMKGQKIDWKKFGIKRWYDEVANMKNGTVEKFNTIPGKTIGHYTQMVWAESTRIGCGVRTSSEKCSGIRGFEKYYCRILVCNYNPPGNYLNEKIYTTTGDRCTNLHENYKFLCV